MKINKNMEVDTMAKSKNKKNERIINVGYQYSKEELTKINAEAYYLAIKRLEEEKQKIEENKPDSQTNKLNKKESIKRTLLLLMLPTKAYKKDSTNKKTTDETLNINIVDSLISSFVAFVWRTFGILLRFFFNRNRVYIF